MDFDAVVYLGNRWTDSDQILYWNSKSRHHDSGCAMNVAMDAFPSLLEKRKTSSLVPQDHVELRGFFFKRTPWSRVLLEKLTVTFVEPEGSFPYAQQPLS
jgi:hypothetical protein